MSNPSARVELEAPRFGEFARQIAGVSSAQIVEALAKQQAEGGRLGAILVEAGLLTEEKVVEILRSQARWVARMRSADLPGFSFPLPAPVSLCMPCFNEEQVVHDVLLGMCAILPEYLDEFEIVVVDDGSSDNTAEVVRRFSDEIDDRVRLVQHEMNRGYGAAVTTAMRAAHGDWVFFTDGDGQFNLLDMPQLLVDAHMSDVVVGYRYNRADHALRSVNATGWKWIVRGLLGVKIRDLDCAFKIFPRRVLDRLQLDSEGACINAEMMAQISRGGVSVREVPVNHYSRSVGDATGANLKVIAKAFRELPVLWKYRSMKPWRFDEDQETLGGYSTPVDSDWRRPKEAFAAPADRFESSLQQDGDPLAESQRPVNAAT